MQNSDLKAEKALKFSMSLLFWENETKHEKLRGDSAQVQEMEQEFWILEFTFSFGAKLLQLRSVFLVRVKHYIHTSLALCSGLQVNSITVAHLPYINDWKKLREIGIPSYKRLLCGNFENEPDE